MMHSKTSRSSLHSVEWQSTQSRSEWRSCNPPLKVHTSHCDDKIPTHYDRLCTKKIEQSLKHNDSYVWIQTIHCYNTINTNLTN